MPTATATATVPPTATLAPTATRAATPSSIASPDPNALAEYVDPAGDFAVGYPRDWRRLTEDEILAQLGIADEGAAEAALANTALVAVSPDGQAIVSLTKLPLGDPDDGSLDAIVRAVREANAASVGGIGDVETETIALDGVDAVRLTFTAVDPATGAADGRLVRQVITTFDDGAIVLSFVVRADAADEFAETFDRVEESWRWR